MSSSLGKLYIIREYRPDDKAFVMATFLRGLYYGDSWFSVIPKDIFFSNYKHVVEGMLSSPKVSVQVACKKDEPDVIFGYSILSADYSTIHWVYVKGGEKGDKNSFRRLGIAKSLLPKYPTKVTHLTKLGLQLLTKFPGCIFDPFSINK